MASDPPEFEFEDMAEAEAELDRLAVGLVRRELPQDIVDLMEAIAIQTSIRIGLPEHPPYQFGRFEAFDTKMGGMGMVIEARDPQLDRKVALKVWMTQGPAAERALMAEAKLLAKLNHPNVVTIHDQGTWQGRVYFVMEWVDGRDGHGWMTEQRRPWDEVRDVYVLAGRGLAAAHEAGILHRDFKPSNMLVGHDGRVLVADFGVGALMRSLAADQDVPGKQAGTPEYMAPERLRGHNGDARSDQFSFCVAIWRALHGLRPYAGEAPEQLLAAIESRMIRGVWTDDVVPRWLSRVVVRGLQADPDDRFDDMEALIEALTDEPAEPSSVDDMAAPQEPPDDDERVLHAPVFDHGVLIAERRKARRQFFLYGALCGVAVMAPLVIGLEREPLPSRANRTAPPTHAIPVPPPPEEAPDPAPRRVQTTPEQVIDKIHEGKYDEADALWLTETEHLNIEDTPTHADSIRIGEEFLKVAKRLAEGAENDRALEITEIAKQWGHSAIANLKFRGQPTKAGTDFVGDVTKFRNESLPSHNK